MTDVPDAALEKRIYIVGEPNYPWLATFKCPCGCKKTIQLNLLEGASPQWSYTIKKRKITIKPSVWRTGGCKSHFFIRDGKIRWVK
ncbi:MAG: hypothetical protein JWQ09_4922 [Segetibacter sp.]|nr:hypothetical protein [Segetibacter sp.]